MGVVGKAVVFLVSPIIGLQLFGGKIGKLIASAALIAAGIITENPQLVLMGIANAVSALQKKPKVSPATAARLDATLDPATPRGIVLGRTAMHTDVRYQAFTGSNQEYYEQILCVASHKVEAVEEVWFDTELAWTVGGGAQGRFAGYLTIAVKLEGTAANTVAIDANWGSAQRLTGCAYLHLKLKRTGNTSKAESPFSQSIPSRVTVRGKGAFVPDPRLSTSAGGSGSQDMADQSTWAYTTAADSGRNPACQTLFYLLGWKINGKLAVALGSPPARIDFASFINAANVCDESVAKAGGGTEPRYRSDAVFNEDDDPDTVLTTLLQAMNAELTDESGKIAVRIDLDDLATPAVSFTQIDIIDGDDWNPTAASQDKNVVRGKYTDPSDGALYQLVDYPQVTLAGADYGSLDGIQRIESFDLPAVQSPSQAQRLAKLRLQRRQYPGVFVARFNMRAWAATYGKIVALSYSPLSFATKKFRVQAQIIHVDGTVTLSLREVTSAQFSWSAEEVAIVAAAAPTAYNPVNDPLISLIGTMAPGATRNILYRQTTDPAGSNTLQDGDIWVDISTTPTVVKIRIGASWQISSNYVTQGSQIGVENGATKNTLTVASSAPGSPTNGDIWVDTSVTPNVVRTRSAGAWVASSNLVTQGTDIGVANGATKNVLYRQTTDPIGSNTLQDGDVWVDTSTTPMVVKIRIGASWQVSSNYVTQGSHIGVDNGATKNTLTVSSSAPGSPTNGDIWVDTSVTPNVVRTRSAGAWVASANLVTQGTDIGVANNAGTSGLLTAIGTGSVVTGNSVKKTSGTHGAFEGGAVGSALLYTAYLSTNILGATVGGGWDTYIALDDDNTSYALASQTWAVRFNAYSGGGDLYIYSAGTIVASGHVASVGANSRMEIAYDGTMVAGFVDGAQIASVAAGASLKFYPKVIEYYRSDGLAVPFIDVVYGPFTDRYLDNMGDGTTYARTRLAELTGGYLRLTQAGGGRKLGDVRALPNIAAFNLSYKFTGAVSYTSAAGTPATATISVTAGNTVGGSVSIAYNAMSVGVSGTGGTTISYYLYVDDPTNAGGAQTLVATSTQLTSYQADGRILIGYVDVVFPTSGTGGGSGGSGGGPCVCADSFVETARGSVVARDVRPGEDMLLVLNDDRTGFAWELCTAIEIADEECWAITASNGFRVTVSRPTPITLRDGSLISVPQIAGHELPVADGGLRWLASEAERVGRRAVAKIHCNQRTYAAGDEPGRPILTHNPKP